MADEARTGQGGTPAEPGSCAFCVDPVFYNIECQLCHRGLCALHAYTVRIKNVSVRMNKTLIHVNLCPTQAQVAYEKFLELGEEPEEGQE